MVNEKNQFIYIGVVEGRGDPLQAGRVQVRVFEVHSADRADLPTESLPWATVAMFNVESGVGTSEVLVEGTRVVVSFLDKYFQEPIVLGVLPGVSSSPADPSTGFNDPNGVYPLFLESDLSRLARGQDDDRVTTRKTTIVQTSLFDEPETAYAPTYPLNRVVSSESGHAFELDDTPGAERINLQHRTGSFMEYHPDGSRVSKVFGHNYEIIMSDNNLYVKGQVNVAVAGDVRLITEGNVDHSIGGKYVINAGGNVEINGAQIHLNTGDATTEDLNDSGGAIDVLPYNRIYVQATEPAEPIENDLWIDTASDNQIKAFVDDEWIDVTDARLTEATDQRLFARQKVISQPDEPDYRTDGPFANGDIWIDTDDSDKRYIWNTLLSTWSFADVSGLGDAILQAGISRAVKDGFTAIFKSSSIPTGAGESDYWFRSDTNSVYQLRNSEWKNLDNAFLSAKLDEILATTTFYLGVHYSETEPSGAISRDGDYWIVPSTNTVYLLDGAWTLQTDSSFATLAQSLTTDRSIRDGRIRISIDYVEPTGADEGDLWIDISNDPVTNAQKNWVYVYSGTDWERVTDPDLENTLIRSINYKEVEDHEITVYFAATEPDANSSPVPKIGDIWYNTSSVSVVDDTGYDVGGDPFAPDAPATVSASAYRQSRYNGARWISVDDYRLEDSLARINVEQIRRIAQGEALAQQITDVTTQVGDNQAQVREVLTSIDGMYGGIGLGINANGHVSGLNLISGYEAELVFTSGTGDFRIGETVYVGASLGAATWTGKVITWNYELKRLRIVSETGTAPSATDHVIGDDSAADFVLDTYAAAPAPSASLFEIIAQNIRFIDPSDPLNPITPFSISGGVVYIGNVNTDNYMITYIGAYASAPSVAGLDENSVYKNTTDGNSYILVSGAWTLYLEKGTDGVDGADGADGSAGVDARGVSITASDQSIEYDTAGANPDPVSVTLTASATNTSGTVYYEFFINDVSVQNTTANTYVYSSPSAVTSLPAKAEVQIREGASTGTILARDQTTIVGLREGSDGVTLVLSNEAHTLPTTNTGTVTYTGSGTDIQVWIGTVAVPYDDTPAYATPSFRVSTTPANITAGSASTVSTYTRRFADHSTMTNDYASISYTITVVDVAGTETVFTKVQSFAKSKGGADGVDGADGADGAAGTNARGVSLIASDQTVEYNSAGNSPSPSSVTLTASPVNTAGTVYYQFFINDVSVQNTTSNTYVYSSPASVTGLPVKAEVQIREGASTGDILARDQTTITGLKEGSDGVAIILGNEAHTLPTTNTGTVTYTGSGTDIEVWIGTQQVPYDDTSPYASPSFRIVATPANITVGAASTVSTYTRRFANHSAMTNDAASISFAITVKDAAGVERIFTRIQSLSKSKQGEDGATGVDGVDGNNGNTVAQLSIFKRSASAPSTPTGGSFNFDTLTLTPPVGWSVSVPAGTDPVYSSVAIASIVGTSGTDNAITWASPEIFVQNGVDGADGNAGGDGKSVYSAIVFNRSASAPSAPSGGSFNFGTNTLTPPSGWYLDVPAGTDPIYGTRFVFSIVGDTGTDSAGTWSTPFRIAEDGVDGLDGSDGADGLSTYLASVFKRSASTPSTPTGGSYNFGTNSLTAPSTWSESVPAGTDPIYVSTALASVQGVTGIDSTLTWTSAQLLAKNGVDGANGSDGSAGVNARGVNLSLNISAIVYNSLGSSPSPINATATATAVNASGTVYYQFFLNDVAQQNTTSNTYLFNSPSSIPSTSLKIEVQIREGSSGGTILARDQITVPVLRPSTQAISIALSNEAHTLPRTTAGTVTYTNSGTDINVWEGTTQLPYNATLSANSSWRITSAVGTNITVGSASTVSTNTRRFANHSAMTASPAYITFTIEVKNSEGLTSTFTRIQSLSFSQQGATGATGATGSTGAAGVRGSVFLYASGTSWSDATANAAILAATGSSTKVIGDVVTIHDSGTGFSATKAWDGSVWTTVTQVIDGGLLVNGTVIGNKIAANVIDATKLSVAFGTFENYIRVGEDGSTTDATFIAGNTYDTNYRIWSGDEVPANAAFSVDKNGKVIANDLEIYKDGELVFSATAGFTDFGRNLILLNSATLVNPLVEALDDNTDYIPITLTESTDIIYEVRLPARTQGGTYGGGYGPPGSPPSDPFPSTITVNVQRALAAGAYSTILTQVLSKNTHYEILFTSTSPTYLETDDTGDLYAPGTYSYTMVGKGVYLGDSNATRYPDPTNSTQVTAWTHTTGTPDSYEFRVSISESTGTYIQTRSRTISMTDDNPGIGFIRTDTGSTGGAVTNADTLNLQPGSYYLNATNLTNLATAIAAVDGAGSGIDSDSVDGYSPTAYNVFTGNAIVTRHASGYIYSNYFNTTANTITSGVTKVAVQNGDNFIRWITPADLGIGGGGGGDADTFDGLDSTLFVYGTNASGTTGAPSNDLNNIEKSGFWQASGAGTHNGPTGDTWSWVIHQEHTGLNGYGFQLASAQTTNKLFYRRQYANTWQSWLQLADLSSDQTFSGITTFSGFTSTANSTRVTIKPTDYGTGKPALNFKKSSTANIWGIELWDGTNASGTINFASSSITHNGNEILRDDMSVSSQVLIDVKDADFILQDSTDGTSNWLWRDWSAGILYIGTSNAQPQTRYDLYTDGGSKYWHAGNDGSGSGLDADLLDGINSTSFARVDAATNYYDYSLQNTFYSNSTIASASGNQSSLQVFNGTLGNDAFMTFHVSGDYAVYFGLSGADNDLCVGGWSKGANKYKIWHAGNDGSGSGLDADTLDGLHDTSFGRYGTAGTWSTLQTFGAGIKTSISGSATHITLERTTTSPTICNIANTGNYIDFDYNGSGYKWRSSASDRMTLTSAGALTTTGAITASSDARLKENISDLEAGLDMVMALRPVKFDWIDGRSKNDIGLIAQEVREIVPPFVVEGEVNELIDHLSVDYGRISVLNTKAIQEQQAKIISLETRIDNLLEIIHDLKGTAQ